MSYIIHAKRRVRYVCIRKHRLAYFSLFFLHGNGNMHDIACVSYTRMKSVLLRWMPSLNDPIKLKGQYTDVKSGSAISVGPSLKPHSLS